MRSKLMFLVIFAIAFSVQTAISQTDEQPSPSYKNLKAMELIKRAIAFEDSGMFEKAIDVYKEVLKLESKDFAAMTTIAGLYGKLEDPVNEEMWSKKAIETNPKFFQAFINYGNALAMQERFVEAVKVYKDAQVLAPTSPLPVYSQGVVAENQHKFQEALSLYKKSYEIDSKFEDGMFSAAAMHANLKQFAEAKMLLKKLLELNPDAQDARLMLRQIEREKP